LRYLFEEYAFDTDRRELHRGAEVVSVAPQVFDLLDYLIRNRERVVSKDDLINAIWDGRIVTEAALTTRLNVARTAIGDSGSEQRLIKTLPRKGFRFVGPVLEAPGPAGAAAVDNPVEPPKPALALPDESSIAVLPFTNLSSDPDQEYFAGPISAKAPADSINIETRFSALQRVSQELRTRKRPISIAAAVLLAFTLVAVDLSALYTNSAQDNVLVRMLLAIQSHPASELFSGADAQRIAEIAEKKELPVPAFQIRKPANDVPANARRFIGVWVSDTGWMISNRQLMMIVTDVDRDGVATGYVINGPPGPKSQAHNPANAMPFTGRISGNTLVYNGPLGAHVITLTVQGRIEYTMTFTNGTVGAVSLDSAWNLVEAERVAAAKLTAR
jgi:DNA-binding winged helix-turn-helix (wHTH) protein